MGNDDTAVSHDVKLFTEFDVSFIVIDRQKSNAAVRADLDPQFNLQCSFSLQENDHLGIGALFDFKIKTAQ